MLFELIKEGGIIVYILIFLSVVATAIIIERFMYFRKIRVDEEKMIARLEDTLDKGHYDEALSICDTNPSPITNLMKIGIGYKDASAEQIKDTIQTAANLEIPRMEKYLSALGTIAHIAPLLGLLGTVTGNIKSFGVMGGGGVVGDPSLLAKGISEALITTAAGLIVAIPAVIFYNHLVNKVNHTIIRLESRVNDLVHILKKTDHAI